MLAKRIFRCLPLAAFLLAGVLACRWPSAKPSSRKRRRCGWMPTRCGWSRPTSPSLAAGAARRGKRLVQGLRPAAERGRQAAGEVVGPDRVFRPEGALAEAVERPMTGAGVLLAASGAVAAGGPALIATGADLRGAIYAGLRGQRRAAGRRSLVFLDRPGAGAAAAGRHCRPAMPSSGARRVQVSRLVHQR